MARYSNNKCGLTQNELELEAQRLMRNELDSESEFLDPASEYSEHQYDKQNELNDTAEGSVYSYCILKTGRSRLNIPSRFLAPFNLINHLSGVFGEAQATTAAKPVHTWKSRISDELLQKIIEINNITVNMTPSYNLHKLSCPYFNNLHNLSCTYFYNLHYYHAPIF